MGDAATPLRIDKWLWAARFFKTRALATEAVLGGHVHLNGMRCKPAKDVRVGDRVEMRKGSVRYDLVVRGLAERRGPASVAAGLYEETLESKAEREQHATERRLAAPIGAGFSSVGPPCTVTIRA